MGDQICHHFKIQVPWPLTMSQTEMAMSEPETSTSAAENIGQALTLGNMLIVTSFTITVMAVILPLKDAGGGLLRYILGVPLALALGTLIVWLSWRFQKSLWLRSEGATKRKEYVIAVVFLLSMLFFIGAGVFAGDMLASLLIKLLA